MRSSGWGWPAIDVAARTLKTLVVSKLKPD